MDRYPNKRIRRRTSGGQFRKATMADVGISGTCPTCRHFMTVHYYGTPGDPFPDPRKFRPRCWTCEPETDDERTAREAYESKLPKKQTLGEFFQELADREDKNE